MSTPQHRCSAAAMLDTKKIAIVGTLISRSLFDYNASKEKIFSSLRGEFRFLYGIAFSWSDKIAMFSISLKKCRNTGAVNARVRRLIARCVSGA
jgi:hypothetical protein